MDRLTHVTNGFGAVPTKYDLTFTLNARTVKGEQEILDRLGEYEDTGLTPEQIREMDKLYREKCEEVNELKKEKLKLESMIENGITFEDLHETMPTYESSYRG